MNSPHDTRKLDLIPVWQTGWRKLVAFRTVSQKRLEGSPNADDLIARIAAIQKEAAQNPDLSVKTAALWRMESLGVTFGRHAQPGHSLNRADLPAEARPVAHVGMGAAAVEVGDFEPVRITLVIDALSHPDYRLFAHESLGAMLGVYERPAARRMLGLRSMNRPEDSTFFRAFPSEVQRLISHGFGRLLYFHSPSIRAALQNVVRREFLDSRAAVQGMAFGYAMVNHKDLSRVLETGEGFADPCHVQAFKAGLVYALMFWEWQSPGFLQTLRPSGSRAEDLIALAREEIAAARRRGFLEPFVVRKLASNV